VPDTPQLEVIRAPEFSESNGSLFVFDSEHLPFAAERIFFVRAPRGALRGEHAHREGKQFLAVLAGKVDVTTVATDGSRHVSSLGVGDGLYLPPRIWSSQFFVDTDSLLLVLCDGPYDEADYIRNEAEFLALNGGESST
jgi:dTDP-4-dehydrorhamnose 3,5-epimerase-like enzyme